MRPIVGFESSSSLFLATPKARNHNAEGFEAGLRRGTPQLGTQMKALYLGIDWSVPDEAMLRTPSAIDGMGGAISEDQARERNRMVQVRDQVAQLAFENGLKVSPAIEASLLPTPNTMEHREIKTPEQIAALKEKSPGGYRNLRESVVNELLPTPIVRDYKDGPADSIRDGKISVDTVSRAIFSSGEVELIGTPRANAANSSANEVGAGAPKARIEDQVLSTSWGKFEPAIRRWEALTGRPAPAPTKPDGKDGAHRLSSKFTEWMMGLPDGWITDCGLTRVDELKAAGNGVVPQQAVLALELLDLRGVLGL